MKLIIFISKEDDFYGSALKIKDISKIETNIVNIEDFISNEGWNNITDDTIIYFLCNGNKVNFVLNKIHKLNKKCKIINMKYLLKNDLKSVVQKKMNDVGISVPMIFDNTKIDEIKFPIFCKQNTHAGIVFKAYTKKTIIDFFNRFNKNDFYLEEAVTSDLESHKEFKVYFANEKVFPKDNSEKISNRIKKICLLISKTLYDLDTFSVDFIENSKGLYLIDINVASGFYLSTGARKEFVKKYVNN